MKSFTFYFKRTEKGRNLIYQILLTVIIQVKGMLNLRPLNPMLAMQNDYGDFSSVYTLIGILKNTFTESELYNVSENKQ